MLANLSIVQTSPACVRYQLLDAAGKRLWSNRVVPCPEGHAGARERMAAWALRHGVSVQVERRQPADLVTADRGRR